MEKCSKNFDGSARQSAPLTDEELAEIVEDEIGLFPDGCEVF
jgi:hypothetical protein